MSSLQKISDLYYYHVILQPKEFVMQIDTYTLQRMFSSIMVGQPVGSVNGFVIQHDTFYNGHETRYSLRCLNPELGNKFIWQAWMIPNRKPNPDDINRTCVNRTFGTDLITEHDGLWYYDPENAIEKSAVTLMGVRSSAFNGGGQLGFASTHHQMFNNVQPRFNMPMHDGSVYYPGPGTPAPQFPSQPYNPFHQQPRMDQVGGAFGGTQLPALKDRAKVMRTTLLTRFGVEETNRLVSQMLKEVANPDKWKVNEDNNDVGFVFFGDPKFDSQRDRIVAMKQLREVLEAQGYTIGTADVENFTISVRLP